MKHIEEYEAKVKAGTVETYEYDKVLKILGL